MQEDQIALPFLRLQRGIARRIQILGQPRQLVIVRREQGPAAIDFVQVLGGGPGNRQAVKGRRAAADLVQDDKAARRRLVEDGGGLDHLGHEGGAPARQVVRCTDARIKPVGNADLGAFSRHIATGLGQHQDQGVLAQIGRLTGHVRTGHEGQAGRVFPRSVQLAGIGGKSAFTRLRQGTLDHWVSTADD